jgi:hypothetical protein
MEDPGRLRDAVQTVTLLARAVGVMDARARGLVVQAVLPAKALVGAKTSLRCGRMRRSLRTYSAALAF